MALREIRVMGDPVLTKVCREVTEVTPKITELIDDMFETMYEANGVGLAAPQVGILKRIVVIDVGEGPIVLINPKIVETSGIARDTDGIVKDENGNEIPTGTHVSMNMWGVTPEFLDVLDKGFAEFLANVEPGNIKAEYLLPTIIGDMLEKGEVSVKVLETQDKWFGVTYQEDRQTVVDAFAKLIADGVYKTPLF